MYDAIVIGGGPAGLQATLTLGRMHRKVLMLDSGRYRNEPAAAMHNIVTNDGRAPADFRRTARAELTAYDTVEVREIKATSIARTDDGFTLTANSEILQTRAVVLATGVRDVLPDVPGLSELWGDLVHHCPFCHGHELAGKRIALQDSPHAEQLIKLLTPISDQVEIVADIRKVARDGADLRIVTGTGEVTVDGLFAAPTFEQSAPFAVQLGLDLNPSGCIEIDLFGHTSVPGVYAAGDLAHHPEFPMPMASVLAAANAGLMAGSSAARELALEGPPSR